MLYLSGRDMLHTEDWDYAPHPIMKVFLRSTENDREPFTTVPLALKNSYQCPLKQVM